MSKIIDITNKLNFDERPKLVIKGTEIEVNNDAIFLSRLLLFSTARTVCQALTFYLRLSFSLTRRTEKRLQNFISRLPTSQLLLRQQQSLSPTMTARGKFRPRLRLNR